MSVGSRRLWDNIDLICRAGLDVHVLTPLLCRHIRDYIGADATAIFWMDPRGMPIGFHHEDSPDTARDLFVNEFERLFAGPAETNVASLAKNTGRSVGNLLAPDAAYYRSNTYNLLVRASGHHHSLDLRVDHDGQARIIVILFREQSRPFRSLDAERLKLIESCLLQALRRPRDSAWITTGEQGHLLIAPDSGSVVHFSEAARDLLRQCTLVGQDLNLVHPASSVPVFIRALCQQAADGGIPHRYLDVPAARILLRAEVLQSPGLHSGGIGSPILVTLERQVPDTIAVMDRLLALKLSPTQKRLLLCAAQGTSRTDAASTLQVGAEAMKKHLSVIYAHMGVNTWSMLGSALGAGH